MNAYRPVNRVAEYTHEGKELFDHYPVMTVAIVFGLGVATGLVAVNLLCDSAEPTSRHSAVAHRLGNQILDALSSVKASSVLSTLKSYT